MHPLCAFPNNQTGALGMNSGDRIRCASTGKTGIVDEFLPDGEALVSWDDGSFSTPKWSQIEPASTAKRSLIPVIAVIHSGRVLMLQRAHDSKYPDSWCIPGGKIEPGETALACAVRELREETGLIVAESEMRLHRELDSRVLDHVRFAIHYVLLGGSRPPVVSMEPTFQGFGWFSMKDIAGLEKVMSPADQIADIVGVPQ